MKHTKKLIPAIGMLLLSACMLVTSTFAWFSMNTEVTASGMTVSAKADQIFLQINNTNSFSNSGSMTSTTAPTATASAALYPTAVVDTYDAASKSITAFTAGSKAKGELIWVNNYSKTAENSAGVAGEYTTITNAKDFYLVNTFYVRLNPAAGRDTALAPLTSSVKLDTTYEDAIAESLSILVVCGNKAQLWKQTSAGTFANSGDAALTEGAFKNVKVGTEAEGSYSGAVAVEVYVFFDGENTKCTTQNYSAIKANGYAVTVSLNVTPVPDNGQGA